MAATACALVERRSHLIQRITIPLVHIGAGAVGGGLAGWLLGLFGAATRAFELPLSAALVVLALGAASYDLARGPLHRLQPPVGVPASWRRWPPLTVMAAYGFVLGAGLFTPFGAAAMYALVALVVLMADPLSGALVFGSYGAARALVSMGVAGITLSGRMSDPISTLQRAKARWRPILGVTAAAAVALFLALPRF